MGERSLLVVDDDPVNRDLLCQQLSGLADTSLSHGTSD
jgi:CheY-like chemotaxis protein